MENFEADLVVIGAGVIGLAIARRLALAGRDVVVLEAEPLIGSQTSSRNSEVIHAGLYYSTGSLKARCCVAGRRALYDYLDTHQIAYRNCGKLVVAYEHEAADLETILARAKDNGVEGLSLITGAEARKLEPALSPDIAAALHADVSGIFDSHGYMLSLQGELEDCGGVVAFETRVAGGEVLPDGVELVTAGPAPVRIWAKTAINAAGHQAIALAGRIAGPHTDALPTPHFVKGSYFSVTGKTPFSHLIYPMPTSASLGLHLTVDLSGSGRLGPDAEWLDKAAGPPFDYSVDPRRAADFLASARRYWPTLDPDALAPGYSGVRPKLVGPGEASGDFWIRREGAHLVNLLGIESPGLTSSLAIADHVAGLLV